MYIRFIGLTAHCSVAQVAELVEALNRITDERHRTNRSLATIAREALEKKSPNLPAQIKSGEVFFPLNRLY